MNAHRRGGRRTTVCFPKQRSLGFQEGSSRWCCPRP